MTTFCNRLFRSAARCAVNDAGSLALEQVLFIGAIVLLTAGVYSFYQDVAAYFTNFSLVAPPAGFGAP